MIEQTREGHWVIQGDQWMGKWVHETQRLDHDQYSIPIACSNIVPGTIVIDVGANIGSHTAAYLQACGRHGTVVAYEPNPEPFQCLSRNCSRALCYEMAVGEIVGTGHLIQEFPNVGASFLGPAGHKVVITTLDVHTLGVLCSLLEKPVSFIKIDVEGCEPEVLKGGEELITKYRPVIMLEINNGALKRREHNYMEIFEFMNRHSYLSSFFPPDNTWESAQSDVVFTPM